MSDIKISMRCNSYYKKGNDVKIVVTLENCTEKDLYVLKRCTPFETNHCNCFNITYNGNKIKYDSIMAKRSRILHKNEFMLVESGASKSVVVSIAHMYPITNIGSHTISLNTRILYTDSLDNISDLSSDVLMPNEKKFYICGRGKACATLGMQHRKNALIKDFFLYADPPTEFPEPSVEFMKTDGDPDNPSKEEALYPSDAELIKGYIRKAHYEMIFYLQKSISDLTLLKDAECLQNLHYKMAFGDYDATRFTKVKNDFETILAKLKTKKIVYKYDPRKSQVDCIGYVISGVEKVFLCEAFKEPSRKLTGEDSKMGTIFHELSHIFANTDDHHYFREDCRDLAKNSPELAVSNADSFEFFLETVFLNQMLELQWGDCNNVADTPYGGPVVVCDKRKTFNIYYLSTDNKIQTSNYNETIFGSKVDVIDSLKKTITSNYHPEAVNYNDVEYLFYIASGDTALSYTYKEDGVWQQGKKIEYEIGKYIFPPYPPRPIIFNNKIILTYKKNDANNMYMISFDGKTWSKEDNIPNTTAMSKEISSNPSPFIFNNQLYIAYAHKNENEILYAVYNSTLNLWTMSQKINIESDIDPKTNNEICAVSINESVLMIYRKLTNNKTFQIQMNLNKFLNLKLWTDNENFDNSSCENCEPHIGSVCSCFHSKKFFYAAYKSSNSNHILICQKINI